MISREQLKLWKALAINDPWAIAREAVPILLAEVEAQAKEIERLRERERAARIEAVEEFRERARGECYDEGGESGWLAHTIAKRIAALPALPEEP